MKFLIALFALLALLAGDANATAQVGEILEYEGKRHRMFSTPLEDYFRQGHKRPDFPVGSTACWRGYVGVWKIVDSHLFLVSLHKEDHENDEILGKAIPLKSVFGSSQSPVKADWFTGVLRLPQGERIRYVHMGYGSIYEKELYLTVQKGKVVTKREIDNSGIGASRSTSDLQWVALAAEPVKDDGKWTDARTLAKMKEDTDIVTRGIYFPANEHREPAKLFIPDTPTTEPVEIELTIAPPTMIETPAGSHVEIKGRLIASKNVITVKSARALKPGETMHHPKFKAVVEDGAK